MKAITFVLLTLALAVKVFALPTDQEAANDTVDDYSVHAMEFVGPITPGSSDVTLYGTAEEIYGQIMQLNPSYNVWDFPEYSESLTADGFTTADLDITNMSANPQTVSRNNLLEFAKYQCDKPPKIEDPLSKNKCGEGLKYLRKIGGKCGVKGGKGDCQRVSCSNNCGMSICLKDSGDVKVRCKDIANHVEKIIKKCMDNEHFSSGKLLFKTHHIKLHTATC